MEFRILYVILFFQPLLAQASVVSHYLQVGDIPPLNRFLGAMVGLPSIS